MPAAAEVAAAGGAKIPAASTAIKARPGNNIETGCTFKLVAGFDAVSASTKEYEVVDGFL